MCICFFFKFFNHSLLVKLWENFESFNPLTPKSDKHLTSPYNISLKLQVNVKRIEEMINQLENLLTMNQILLFSTLRNI